MPKRPDCFAHWQLARRRTTYTTFVAWTTALRTLPGGVSARLSEQARGNKYSVVVAQWHHESLVTGAVMNMMVLI